MKPFRHLRQFRTIRSSSRRQSIPADTIMRIRFPSTTAVDCREMQSLRRAVLISVVPAATLCHIVATTTLIMTTSDIDWRFVAEHAEHRCTMFTQLFAWSKVPESSPQEEMIIRDRPNENKQNKKNRKYCTCPPANDMLCWQLIWLSSYPIAHANREPYIYRRTGDDNEWAILSSLRSVSLRFAGNPFRCCLSAIYGG